MIVRMFLSIGWYIPVLRYFPNSHLLLHILKYSLLKDLNRFNKDVFS